MGPGQLRRGRRLQLFKAAACGTKKDGEKRGSCSLPAGFMLKAGLCQIQTV